MKKKAISIIVKVTFGVIAVMLAIFIGIEIFVHTYNPVETQIASMYTHEKLLTVDGTVVRDEQYITYSSDRVLDYTVQNGQKVSAGDTIALSYATVEDAENGRRSSEIRSQIDHIKSISSVNDYYVLDLDRIKSQITQSVYGISSSDGRTGVAPVYDSIGDLSDYVTKKQAATGISLDFSQRLQELENEKNRLDGLVSQSPKSVKASTSGYFFNTCDGYEKSFDIKNIRSMTVDDYHGVKPGEVPSDAIGKVSVSFEWYYIFETDKSVAQEFSEGAQLEMRFPTANASSFPATVEKINYSGDKALVILSCSYMGTDYAVERDQTVQIIVKRYDGLYVDYDAIRINDGVKGVYVLVGVEVKFRTIDVLFASENFVVAKAEEAGSGGLQLYDYVITKGNDLYDGKLIYRQTR